MKSHAFQWSIRDVLYWAWKIEQFQIQLFSIKCYFSLGFLGKQTKQIMDENTGPQGRNR
jgi:hypothetical protein